MHVRKAITINRPPEEVYRYWHDFENLPRFMSHLEAVQVTGARRSHWRGGAAAGPTGGRGAGLPPGGPAPPAGQTVEWDAEMTEDRPNELVAWRSLDGADIPNSGAVQFRPAPRGRGTEINVELQFDAPGGKLGRTVAKLFGKDPGQQVA